MAKKPTPTKTDAIVVKPVAAIEQIPDYLRAQLGNRAGMEDVGRNDMIIPRLAAAQALSPQLKKSNALYMPELEVGELFNTASCEIYGKSVKVIPLFFFKNRIWFQDLNKGGGILCQSFNAIDGGKECAKGCALCDHAQFTDEPPECDTFYNFMCALVKPDQSLDPIVVSFKRTGLKDAKRWNSMARMTNLPMYAKYYELAVTTKTKGDQEWEAIVPTPLEFVPRELFAQAEAFFKALRDKNIQVDTTGLEEDTSFNAEDSEM